MDEENKKLKEKLQLAINQIEGIILCLQTHGTNLNVPFLIDHYQSMLKKLKE